MAFPATANGMQMISHKYPGVNYQTLIKLTVPDTIKQDYFINFPGKYIAPPNNGGCSKINSFAV